jgi:DNA-binding CsgD family transcriptional regulator
MPHIADLCQGYVKYNNAKYLGVTSASFRAYAHPHATRTDPPPHGCDALTEKEKQTLRLLLAGHDAKSMARHLDLSVHTVNERLRYARRKLSAASSKEAARLLRAAEATAAQSLGPQSLGPQTLGAAEPVPPAPPPDRPDAGPPPRRRALWAIGGLAMITFAAALLALSSPADHPRADAPSAQALAQSPVVRSAKAWLELVDAARWAESYAATGQSFRAQNTLDLWATTSEKVRVPLGRVVSRVALSEESIPAPPNGYQLVRFRTAFAAKPDATETLSLARQDGAWKVAGYYIE